MRRNYVVETLSVILLLVYIAWPSAPLADEMKSPQSEQEIQINVAVTLEKANVVFNMNHLAFGGDIPLG